MWQHVLWLLEWSSILPKSLLNKACLELSCLNEYMHLVLPEPEDLMAQIFHTKTFFLGIFFQRSWCILCNKENHFISSFFHSFSPLSHISWHWAHEQTFHIPTFPHGFPNPRKTTLLSRNDSATVYLLLSKHQLRNIYKFKIVLHSTKLSADAANCWNTIIKSTQFGKYYKHNQSLIWVVFSVYLSLCTDPSIKQCFQLCFYFFKRPGIPVI